MKRELETHETANHQSPGSLVTLAILIARSAFNTLTSPKCPLLLKISPPFERYFDPQHRSSSRNHTRRRLGQRCMSCTQAAYSIQWFPQLQFLIVAYIATEPSYFVAVCSPQTCSSTSGRIYRTLELGTTRTGRYLLISCDRHFYCKPRSVQA
jgi:hypothetical protein